MFVYSYSTQRCKCDCVGRTGSRLLTVLPCWGRAGEAWAGHTELLRLPPDCRVLLSMSTMATLRFTRREYTTKKPKEESSARP
ncbi:hypothetical protein EYF80_064529 [Liparis tanakae]|uniref:Uncharacterized protein n=1 Tax=Liparis tanakae TaxID=230148 RepID=A0A4Z2EAR3_9TELE|nr:hypothetical protein EYF80_064529 [Liparis tanakae]